MAAPLINIRPCLPILTAGGQILTPNNRLRNKLRQAYAYAQQTQGLQQWPAPAIFTLSEWLQRQYEELLYRQLAIQPKILVSQAQRQQLWRQIIAEDNQGAELINPARLASDADSAYRTLELWQLTPDDLSGPGAGEAQKPSQLSMDALHFDEGEAGIFQQWAATFAQQLQEKSLMTFEQLQNQVNQAISAQLLPLPPALGIYGFDDIPPLTQATFSLCKPQSLPLSQVSEPRLQRVELASLDDEIQAAAHWSLQQLLRNPQATIGIIVPNLGQTRHLLERHFTEVFEPHFYLPETERFTLPFNFSAGVPLGKTPFIFDTLQLLKLQSRQWDSEGLCSLLCTPFWAEGKREESDTQSTAELISAIQALSREQITDSQLRHLVHRQSQNPQRHSDFIQWLDTSLQTLADNRRHVAREQSAGQWAEFFLQQLDILRWPGSRRLDSNEYQQMQLWLTLLEDFSQLDTLGCLLTHSQALDQLSQLAVTTPFQAQTPDSPIQILGALEGSGLQFSHCWVLGLNHKQWPPSPQPSPLLPLQLQKHLRMPHVDAEKELHYAQQLTNNYRQCAKHITFSSASQDDESPLLASPLIRDITLNTAEQLFAPASNPHPVIDLNTYSHQVVQTRILEWVNNTSAPPVEEQERQQLTGGSSILRNQAICPFAAFAIHRLGAKAPLPAYQGLSPIDRGHILHNSLASFWLEVKTQQQLLALDEEKQAALLRSHVEAAIAPYKKRAPDIMGPRYTELEISRQCHLITQWLNQEKLRPSFSVKDIETTLKVDFHGLPLTLRLDRLDQLDNGQLIVIDYKTGSPNLNQWQGDRPEEPQLPLYAVCYSAEIHALMFVEVNARQVRPIGLGDLTEPHDGITPIAQAKQDLPEDWQQTCEHWNKTLTQLTEDFLQGEALATFKSQQAMRYYTDILPLTRQAEQVRLLQLFSASAGQTITELPS